MSSKENNLTRGQDKGEKTKKQASQRRKIRHVFLNVDKYLPCSLFKFRAIGKKNEKNLVHFFSLDFSNPIT